MAVAGRGTSELDYETGVDQGEMCEMCDVTAAAGYCVDCEMFICQSCFDRHRRSKNSRSHVLQNVTEKKTGVTPMRFDKCAEHTQQDVKLYCKDHKLTGCAECMLFAHKTCKHEYITETAKQFEESGGLVRVREDIQMLQATHAEYTHAIVSKTKANKMMTKSATDDIDAFTESIIAYANDAKQRVLEEVKVRESANKLQIDQQEDELQTISSQLDVLSSAFEDEEQVHKIFLLAIDAKPKLSSIRGAFSNIDCSSIITDYKFQTSKMLQDMVSNSRPFGRFIDQNQKGDDDDLDFMLKQERKKSQQTHVARGEVPKNGVALSCGHTSSIDNMEKNRTFKCNVCNIINGDQPEGTMESNVNDFFNGSEYYELQFTFPQRTQSKLNCNPGNSYTATSMKGYLCKNDEGKAILKMLKQAFDRKLLFTVASSGSISNGGIELFKEVPYYWQKIRTVGVGIRDHPDYHAYIDRVKGQLAAVGITK